MDFTVPQLIVYFAAWFSFIAGIWALFERAEVVLREDVRNRLSLWLRNRFSAAEMQRWPSFFTAIFDSIFGEQHFSWKCFIRSTIASVSAVIIMSLVVWATNEHLWDEFLGNGMFSAVMQVLFITLMVNILPDYLSLLETRYVIGYVSRSGIFGRSFLLLADLVATTAIFVVALVIARILGSVIFQTDLPFDVLILDVIEEIPEFIVNGSTFRSGGDGSITGIWFYSTFFTSVWVWLFYLSSLFAKLFRFIGKYFDIDRKPLRSLGFICTLIITLLFMVWPLL